MTVTLREISRIFNALIEHTRTREEIAQWAHDVQKAEDARQLELEPKSEATRIWKAITYLSGVDLKSSASEYLHDIDDFLAFRERERI